MLAPLPIDDHLGTIVDLVRERRSVVVVAPPGAGKTTRVAPALAVDGPTILLQPRRVAARSLARRIAVERGWTLGDQVGWHVRFERRVSPGTRLIVATEGILTARLQQDPLLHGTRTVVLDELHERSVHTDLALAMVRQAALARGDLRIVAMSATLDAGPVAEFLGDCPVVRVVATTHPVELAYAPDRSVERAVVEVLARPGGHLLCFLPGAPEIRRAAAALRGRAPDARILPLHGSLGPSEQDAALAPSDRRKLILATNIAETSLTVEGVTDVVDSGWHKVLRRDTGTGIDRLETERIPQDCATQRTGRAGRIEPGRAMRLWDPRERLRPRREPEIRRVDLAGPLLQVLAWGGDPAAFEWFERPPLDAVEAALDWLTRVGAARAGRVTELGRRLSRIPLHPRLGTVLDVARGSELAAKACAVLAEGWRPAATGEATASDVLALVDRIGEAPPGVRRASVQLRRSSGRVGRRADDEERTLLRALLSGYPDRVARRREPGSRRLRMASGHGAVLARESGVVDGEYLVALDVTAGRRGPGSEARVRLASRIEREWLEPTRVEVVHELDDGSGTVRAIERRLYDEIVIAELVVEPDADAARRLMVGRLLERGLGPEADHVLNRARFAELELDVEQLLADACHGRTRLPRVDLLSWLPPELRRRLDRLAPETLAVPSGRRVALRYGDDGTVSAAVKLQELFGMARTPRVGPRADPVLFRLLAPNGRPVQTTRDLESFWNRTYPEVRRELRGRYPKHPWPEDPWSAVPTGRTRPRR